MPLESSDKLVTAPILVFPDHTKPFILDTDASDSMIACKVLKVSDVVRLKKSGDIKRFVSELSLSSTTLVSCLQELLLLLWCLNLLPFHHCIKAEMLYIISNVLQLSLTRVNKEVIEITC